MGPREVIPVHFLIQQKAFITSRERAVSITNTIGRT